MNIPQTHSEVARVRKQIALKMQAAHRGLHAPAVTAPHRFISERMERVGAYQEQLAWMVGETGTLQIVTDVLESLPQEGS